MGPVVRAVPEGDHRRVRAPDARDGETADLRALLQGAGEMVATRPERRERRRMNQRKMKVSGRRIGETYRNAVTRRARKIRARA